MGYNILIVDDSRIVRDVQKRVLNMVSIDINTIFEAENGAKALEVLENEWIDIIFTDINMPIMNGVEFIKELKVREVIGETPVVVVSTEGSEKRIESLLRNGVAAFIKKPFTPEEIEKILKDVLD